MPIDGAAFDPTTFTKNRERFAHVVRRAKLRRYVSSEHFSVDGTLLEAWASHKSLRPKEGPPTPVVSGGRNSGVDFRSQPRSNQTHSSTTDPEALLARKSDAAPAKLSYAGHGLMENRNALIVDMELTQADGRAEREPAAQMLSQASETQKATDRRRGQGLRHRRLRGLLRELGITAHLAQNTTNRRSAIDARTTRHAGHQVSQRIRKRIDKPFGWLKTVGGGRKLRYKGRGRNRAWFLIAGAVYNLIRITALDGQAA